MTAVAAYFTGKSSEAVLEGKIETLEAEQAGRRLSATQLQELTHRLRVVQKPSEPIFLMGLQGNRESIRLANVLKQAFLEAGVEVDGVWEDHLYGGTGPGILIRQEKRDGSTGVAMCDALHRAGLDAKVVEMGNRQSANKVDVIVAYEP